MSGRTSANPAPIIKKVMVPLSAMKAYQTFTQDMGTWWPLATRSISIHKVEQPAKALIALPVAKGEIVEVAADDSRHVWGHFVDCDAPRSVEIAFHMGQPEEQTTLLVVAFVPMGEDSTIVKLTHSGWETYGPIATMMRDGYDTGWDEIFCGAYAKACGCA